MHQPLPSIPTPNLFIESLHMRNKKPSPEWCSRVPLFERGNGQGTTKESVHLEGGNTLRGGKFLIVVVVVLHTNMVGVWLKVVQCLCIIMVVKISAWCSTMKHHRPSKLADDAGLEGALAEYRTS